MMCVINDPILILQRNIIHEIIAEYFWKFDSGKLFRGRYKRHMKRSQKFNRLRWVCSASKIFLSWSACNIIKFIIKMAVKERQSETSFDEIEWNVENEIQLFFAMNGHKPVGKARKPAIGGYVYLKSHFVLGRFRPNFN